jgi:lysophospholipase L1-like esterase
VQRKTSLSFWRSRALAAGATAFMLSVACASDGPDDPAVPPTTARGGSSGAGPITNETAGTLAAGTSNAGVGGMPGVGGSTTGGAGPTGGTSGAAGSVAGSDGGGGASSGGGSPPGTSDVTPCAVSQLSKCTGMPLACHFGGEPGNYEVTVQLGAPSETEVDAECHRRMLTQSTVASSWFSFVTNVRVYEGEPLRPDQDGKTSKGTPGLDIYFGGRDAQPLSICYRPLDKPLMVWLAGDSTVTDQEGTAYAGWGQHLPRHFVSPVSVANYADSGESSGSVLSSPKLWGAIKGGMKADDWVMVQVGHNDKATAAETFKSNLLRMIGDTKAAGARIILVTPISRASGALDRQHVNSVGANLPQIIRDLGKSEDVPVIDLTVTTYEWLQTIDWHDYFANGTDQTHTNHAGADIVSGFVRDAVRTQVPELAKYLR